MEAFLFYAHYALLLVFGISVSAAFSGLSVSGKNIVRLILLTLFCGGLQICVYGVWGEAAVWYWYPIITHLPIVLMLHFRFGRSLSAAVSATCCTYLCCQPAKWFGLVASTFHCSAQAELFIRIIALIITTVVIFRWFAGKIACIYINHNKGAWIFSIIPVVYYLFDYAVSIYSSLWNEPHQLAVEFLPFFLCLGHLVFCAVYYREYESKNEAEQKERLLRIALEQQAREVETIRRSEEEIRRLRHDLKLFLNSLSSCIEQSDKETARKLIAGFSARTGASSVKRFCGNDTLNYVLSDYLAQCQEKGIPFHTVIELSELTVDEILFATILANALDNALNAQKELPAHRRAIRLLLKNSNGKLLLCIKNSFSKPPLFRDGLPVTSRKGHGHGTQSIQYITEILGGNCQFIVEEEWFVLRIVL